VPQNSSMLLLCLVLDVTRAICGIQVLAARSRSCESPEYLKDPIDATQISHKTLAPIISESLRACIGSLHKRNLGKFQIAANCCKNRVRTCL
jgi:hypothetical protein